MLSRLAKRFAQISGIEYLGQSLWQLRSNQDKYSQMARTEENTPTHVLIWSFNPSTGNDQDSNIGHMAIVINNRYVSLWPDADYKSTYGYLKKLLTTNAALKPFHHDLETENGIPTTILKINGLDTQSMNNKIEEIAQKISASHLKFSVFCHAASLLHTRKQYAHCSSIVNEILVAGGFPAKRSHVTPWGSSPTSQYLYYRLIGAEEVTDPNERAQIIAHIKNNSTNKPS